MQIGMKIGIPWLEQLLSRAGLNINFTTGRLDPRITFSRTSNATITKSDGTIGYAPHNLLTYSEQFDNAYWTKDGTTVSSNVIAAPNGTVTADKLVENTATSQHRIYATLGTSVPTISFYVKYAGRRWFRIEFASGSANAWFDVQNGVVGSTTGGVTSTIQSVGNDWYRITASRSTATSFTILALASADGSEATYLGDGTSGIYIWGAQLEIGSTATTYNPTTVKNLLGFTESYENAAWTKSNSFVQTNLLTYSEAFDNAAWSKTTITATANSIVAPNGYQTADTLAASGANSTALQTFTASAVPYTFSVYLYRKTGTGNIDITVDGTTWVTKTITAGWTRVDTTLTPAAGSKTAGIRIVTSGDEVYAWGAQLVQGSTAGDYRRTDAAALPVFYPNHNGVVCAEQIQSTAGNGTVLESYTATGGSMTFSVWMRRVSGTGNVDITMDTGSTWTTQAITTSWARYSFTSTPASGARTAGVRLVTSGDVIQVFGAQLSDSASLDPYVLNAAAAPSAQAYYGARFDYDPVTLEPEGLLIEEQRINLQKYSEFTSAQWDTNSQSTIANASGTSPDGANSLTLITETSGTSQHSVYSGGLNIPTVVSGATNTASVYLKAGTRRYVQFSLGAFANSFGVVIDTTNWTIVGTGNSGTAVYTSSTISNVGNNFYRVTITGTIPSTTGYFALSGTTSTSFSGSATSDGSKTWYCWGAQVEAGAKATSYIPTSASSVTRAADVAVIQGSNFYSWYNQNEGSLYSNYVVPPNLAGFPSTMGVISDGTTQNFILMYAHTTGLWSNITALNTVQFQAQVLGAPTVGANAKQIVAYRANDAIASVSGQLTAQDTTVSVPVVNQFRIGTNGAGSAYINGTIKSIAYYPQRLSNDVLKGLTA